MELTKEQLKKLREEYKSSSLPNYTYGFLMALSAIGVSSEQIQKIQYPELDE